MNIQFLSGQTTTVPTAKGSYQKLDVAYKNLSFGGKVEGKALMSFGAGKPAFDALSVAQAGESFTIDVVKNAAGYNDWVKVTKGVSEASTGSAPSPSKFAGNQANTSPKSTYETPEERAKKQVYIIRQSSVSAAISTLSVGAKAVKPDDVIDLARKYEAFVLGTGSSGFDDLPDFEPGSDPQVD